MNKETMIKGMVTKVAEVQDAQEAVFSFLEEIEDTVASGVEAVETMEQELQALQEALSMAQDLGEAKLIKGQMDAKAEDIELQKAVNAGKKKAKYAELEDKAEAFFKAHKSAVTMFGALDDKMILETSLSELTEAKEKMTGFSRALANDFASVRQVLLDEGIVANENQNRTYRGTHLGQVAKESRLTKFEYQIRPVINELRQAGLQIK
jgi:hypothetical protein